VAVSVSTGEGKIDKDGSIIFISKSHILLYNLSELNYNGTN